MNKSESYIGDDGEVRELDAAFFAQAKRGRPALPVDQRKQRVTILLDADLVETLRASGKGWQTRVNSMLRQTVKP
jgi:uncharacterized protein (DUF4415 family)